MLLPLDVLLSLEVLLSLDVLLPLDVLLSLDVLLPLDALLPPDVLLPPGVLLSLDSNPIPGAVPGAAPRRSSQGAHQKRAICALKHRIAPLSIAPFNWELATGLAPGLLLELFLGLPPWCVTSP